LRDVTPGRWMLWKVWSYTSQYSLILSCLSWLISSTNSGLLARMVNSQVTSLFSLLLLNVAAFSFLIECALRTYARTILNFHENSLTPLTAVS
jgi:hypothetical protein